MLVLYQLVFELKDICKFNKWMFYILLIIYFEVFLILQYDVLIFCMIYKG